MSAHQRNQALANDLARRAIEAAARRQREQAEPDDLAERLRSAANEDGTLSVDDAIGALTGEQPKSFDPLGAYRAARADRDTAASERLFGAPGTSETATQLEDDPNERNHQ